MSQHLRAAAVACFVCAILLISARDAGAAAGKADGALGKHVENFSLRDFHGNPHSLAEQGDKNLVVLVFLGTDCPLAKLYAPRLADLSREYAAKGVVFLGLDANSLDTPTKLTTFAHTHKIEFPLLRDTGNVVADQIEAARTPEVFVLDSNRHVRYHGRIDDQYAVGGQHDKATRRDLALALEELLSGKEVSRPTTPFSGCRIARMRKVEPKGDVTYSREVAAIVNRHCVECHREGELAPFSLNTYETVAGWADTIREVVKENRMPPWFADPQYGKFINDCSLSPAEKNTLFAWIDNGCPQGDPADLPTPPTFVTGWRMGQPDVVYRMNESYTVPAEGTVDYQYFTVDTNLKEDMWVTTAEARPGNAAVVHHIVLYSVPPGNKLRDPAAAQQMGKLVAVYAPGMNPWHYPEGSAMKIEAGSTLVIQAHYTPNGTKQEDRSYVGLKFVDASSVKRQVRYGMCVNMGFVLPPGAADVEVVSRKEFLKDLLLVNLYPHMHYRGKSFKFEAEYPDGRREVLLDVPHYDFAWQLRYDLAEPKLMPKGSKLVCTAHFDNSDGNLWNPDPTQEVRFGLQTWQEMMVGYYSAISVKEENLAKTQSASAAQ
jgi:peroxiredoxin